jgi:transcriptional regulator with XRE-family HTH domain
LALFFDAAWFEARLAACGLTRAAVCAALGVDVSDLDLIVKDQRELSHREVRVLANLLGVEAAELARRAGVGTPDGAPTLDDALARIGALEARVVRLEAALDRRDTDKGVMDTRSLDESGSK